jgi:hypothetical protein
MLSRGAARAKGCRVIWKLRAERARLHDLCPAGIAIGRGRGSIETVLDRQSGYYRQIIHC